MSILDDIVAHKRGEVNDAQQRQPLASVKALALRATVSSKFGEALRSKGLAIIAEIKKASPSRGLLEADFNHRSLAKEYEAGGARALSVLTDYKFFQGRPEFIRDVKNVCALPVLHKDFIIDEYQIYESKILGADAVLLIVKALDTRKLEELFRKAKLQGLDVLVETHTFEEIDIANSLGAGIIGINNRNLETFEVSVGRSLELRSRIRPGAIAVSESGVKDIHDIERLREAGFDAVLVGEGLMTRKNRVEILRSMVQA